MCDALQETISLSHHDMGRNQRCQYLLITSFYYICAYIFTHILHFFITFFPFIRCRTLHFDNELVLHLCTTQIICVFLLGCVSTIICFVFSEQGTYILFYFPPP